MNFVFCVQWQNFSFFLGSHFHKNDCAHKCQRVVINHCYIILVKTHNEKKNDEKQINRHFNIYLCKYDVINHHDYCLGGLQYNTLSTQLTDNWFENRQYFNISDFNFTDILMHRKLEIGTGDLVLFQNKWYFKISDFIIVE